MSVQLPSKEISDAPYAELDVTSNFSFLRGASHPDEMAHRAAELGYAAIAVTDINTLAGVVRAHQAAKNSGIKLCIGSRLRFDDAPDLLVWAENRIGYANLCRLLTIGKRRAEKGSCLLHLEDLLASSTGLIAALAAQNIDPQFPDADAEKISSAAGQLKDVLGRRLSLSISRLYGPADSITLRQIQSISRSHGIPLLATNQSHYHDEHRRILQDVLTCIRHGCTIHQAGFRLFPNGERFLKPPHEMHRLFNDLPQALRRTIELSEQCNFSLDELRYEYPDEIVPAGKTSASYLADLTWSGAAERYPPTVPRAIACSSAAALLPSSCTQGEGQGGGSVGQSAFDPHPSPPPEYMGRGKFGTRDYPPGLPEKIRAQIVHELALIEQLKIEPYFLTVYDLVCYARSRDILCQGRGSAANSAVCYCLGVTSVDPNRIDVLFERFVSAARGEPPDIDIDFEHERREEVIQYVYEKYGRDRAGMTAEVISYRGRSAVRDVGKALGLGLDAVDQMAKRLDGWHSTAPMDSQLRALGLDPTDPTMRLVITLTRELLGFPRHLSQHVGGLVMTRGPLCELVPIENASMPNRTVIEWDKDDIDALGILKVDVLGLGMLTCLSKALKLVNARHGGRERHEGTEARRHEGEKGEEARHEGEEYDANSDASGFNCLAIGNETGSGNLSSDAADAQVGTIWADQSNAQGGSFRSVEYRRGIRPPEHARLSQTSADRAGLPGRIVDTVRSLDRPGNVDPDEDYLRSPVRTGSSLTGSDPQHRSNPPQITNAPLPPPSSPSCLRASVPSCLAPSPSSPSCLALHTIPPEDPGVYHMISDADTIGVFQIESRAQMSMLPRLRPQKFYDLVIEVAIVRPGPIQGDMVHPYLRRRQGLEKVIFPKPELEAVLGKTLGVPLFQEQAMKVAMVAAGFTAEEADQLRRAMAAWRHAGHIERFHRKIIDGMLANGYELEFAERCFNQIRGFGEYGFPESHAASFALLVYASAWIKRYHPAAFCCALLNSQPMGFYQPAQIVRDAREHGVTVRPIDVNFSDWDCTLEPDDSPREPNKDAKETWGFGGPAVRLGLRLIKGLRSAHGQHLVDARRRYGRFESIEHFHQATNLPVSAIECVATADAFTSLPRKRRTALWQTMALSDVPLPLFAQEKSAPDRSGAILPAMPIQQEVLTDYATAGLSLKQHPLVVLREELSRRKIITAAELIHKNNGWVRVAGLVLVRQRPGTASGVVFITLEDETGVANLIVRPDIFARHPQARTACLLQADGRVERQGKVLHLLVQKLCDLSHLLSENLFQSRDFH